MDHLQDRIGSGAILRSQWLLPLCILLLAFLPATLRAQLDVVMVYGTVKDMSSARKLDGVTVSVFKDGAKLVDVLTNASGKYELNLDYGADYKIMCSKQGYVGKNISIDTRNVPDEERQGGHGMNIDFTMMVEIQGVDYSVLLEPFGKSKYEKATGTFEWDHEYTARMRDAQARLMKEYEDRKKREANAEEEFAKAMKQGDEAMAANNFQKAVDNFNTALEIKPGDAVATARLSDARMRLEGQDAEKKLAEQYAALIKEADDLFTKKDYEGSRSKYTAALDLKETEAHPKQRLKEIETILAELAKKAEEEKKAKELQEKYDAAIASADAAFKGDQLDDAQAKYSEASGLKPAEQYPKDQIAAIATRRTELAKKAEEEAKQKELEEKYQAAIATADAAFNGSKWDDATAAYTQASTLKPEESYPKDQLAAIAVKKEEAAKLAEEERLAKELQEQYQAIISAADAAFNSDQLDQAEAKYNEALGLKPEENYPKDQIAAIATKRQQLADQAEQERLARELAEQYAAIIAEADAAFNSQQWDDAAAKYTEASGLKPEEKYPRDQLAAIEKAKAELAQKEAEEQKARELEEQYQAAVASADEAFNSEDWDAAIGKYNEASGLKPAETYPKERLALIDQKKAEAAESLKQQELDAAYDAAIATADQAFDFGDLAAARSEYEKASGLKPAETYPKQRIGEIDGLLAEQAKAAEEERKKAELEARYNDLIAKADAAFSAEEFSSALNDYKDALQIKPGEQHPTDRIAEINTKLDEAAQAKAEEERLLREQQEKQTRYNDLIAAADKAFNAQQFDQARSDYNSALEVKPDEAYPKERLAAIDAAIAQRAQDEEAARLAAEADAAERARQAEADSLAAAEAAAAAARQAEADSLAAAEAAAAARQAEADSLAALERARLEEEARLAAEMSAADRARMEEEERLRKETLEAEYNAHVAAADRAFSGQEWDLAREKYNAALAVMPEAQHPKDRLAAIDAEIARIAEEEKRRLDAQSAEEQARLAAEAEQRRLEEERLAREEEERKRREGERATQERYNTAVAEADLALAELRYQEARDLFAQASDIKPEETYPLTKIDQIDKILADLEKKRIEDELAAERLKSREADRAPTTTSIDIRKEQEAEQFMRDAREREEAEKYERIKKFKSDLELEAAQDAESADQRRAQGIEQRDSHLKNAIGLYEGDEERRRRNAEEMEALRRQVEEAEAQRRQRSADLRSQNQQQSDQLLADKWDLDQQWDRKHEAQVEQMVSTIDRIRSTEADRTARGLEKNQQLREEAEAIAAGHLAMRERGNAMVEERYTQLQNEKRALEVREAQLVNASKQSREQAKQQLDNTPRNQPRDFGDYNRSKLATEYAPGVTEESYTEGNKVIIRRVVVNGNKADEYSKVIAKWGTFYFKNGQSITEAIWAKETEG